MKLPINLIEKYNVPVPRYTSYPPANFFQNDMTDDGCREFIQQSNADKSELISFYLHIPFCHKICHFCGCNAYRPTKKNPVDVYLEALKKEIDMVSSLIDKSRKVSQIHYGGGTPNAIEAHYLKELNELLFSKFNFIDTPEIAIECNPAYLTYEYVDELIAAGFNRFSIGIQDFDLDVLETINREPSKTPMTELVSYLRFRKPDCSINLDFIYGLPGQTLQSFDQSIKQAIEVRPERLVTFSYAHVPWLKKHQNILEKRGLPTSDDKLNMFLSSKKLLEQAGYKSIGLDHYVLPNDELDLAYQHKQLHRNFQGYCTRRTTGQVYAFGVSAISQLENVYMQNTKNTDAYVRAINKGQLAIEKGYCLTEDQKIIREIITTIMCNNYLNLDQLAKKFNKSVDHIKMITNYDISHFQSFLDDDLLSMQNNEFRVTELGMFFIRNIAATFDPNYKQVIGTYSKSV